RNLERQSISVFLPKTEQTQRRGGKFITTVKPLFPGYLFAQVDGGGNAWQKINSTYGVSRIVSTAGKPTRVPAGLVDAIMRRCTDGDIVETEVKFSEGDEVKLASGPFAEWVGEIVEMTADQRAWVLLDFMGRQTRVAFDTRDLLEI
ncbi:MAG: transcription termination/antitermination NusG family protein, partial [Paracoccaceae bacterium]|nr:transcription termination/antitermination NusG family protein [Paracoccaceae bacterium]